MNQDTRNKKNAKYQQNLQKRHGLTKSSDYKAMCSEGILLSEKIKPMVKEFVITRRHDKIVSKEVYTYKWTPEATSARKEYHATKNGVESIPKKPTQASDKKDKKQLLEERAYSDYHNELVQNLYGSNKAERIAKQQAYKAAHEEKIKKIAKQLAEHKMSKKLQHMEQKPYKVVIATTDNEEFKVSYSNLPVKQLTETVAKLNTKLSEKYSNYKSITIIDRITLEKKCFANHLPEIKQAAQSEETFSRTVYKESCLTEYSASRQAQGTGRNIRETLIHYLQCCNQSASWVRFPYTPLIYTL